MIVMRFDVGVGDFALDVQEESVLLLKSMGTICLQLGLEVKAPVDQKVGRLLALQADLYGTHGSYRMLLSRVTEMVPFTPEIGIERRTLKFILTSAQLHAINEARDGDLRMQLEVVGTLPQAIGYPGSTTEVLHFSVARSRWVDQINALGPSVAFEMRVPFPLEDAPRAEPAQHLRSAQRRLLEDDIDGAILDARRALEWIRLRSGWTWPLNKDHRLRGKDERWAAIRGAVEDQASGSVHADAVTSAFKYSMDEAKALISITAALLTVVDGPV
ncbi:hypothetical protein Psi02_76290 [Planotetraspora silvatica]|uniref:Uncharacterized protein n=1 Tax=Planotetraspora silvatica TaxID=234614 RepID=A0A8J3UUZ3_9ACTN|nr:hypothetical protein [Planotetraspora silvatica]GII51205.1 hypothetical protein Psi02_76290 [Planotetraspora silvatica]